MGPKRRGGSLQDIKHSLFKTMNPVSMAHPALCPNAAPFLWTGSGIECRRFVIVWAYLAPCRGLWGDFAVILDPGAAPH